MNQEEKEWFLNLSEEIKLDVLENSLKEDKFGVFMEMTKILLEAPIQNGGISTEKIESIRKKYF